MGPLACLGHHLRMRSILAEGFTLQVLGSKDSGSENVHPVVSRFEPFPARKFKMDTAKTCCFYNTVSVAMLIF